MDPSRRPVVTLSFSPEVEHHPRPSITRIISESFVERKEYPTWLCVPKLPDIQSDPTEINTCGEPHSHVETQQSEKEQLTVSGAASQNMDEGNWELIGEMDPCYKLDILPVSRGLSADGNEIWDKILYVKPHLHDSCCHLNGLSKYFEKLDSANAAVSNLEQALIYGQRSVNATKETHPHRAQHCSSLALIFTKKYDRMLMVDDLQAAIKHTEEAAATTPTQDHLHHAAVLCDLSSLLVKRYFRTENASDLERALLYDREALSGIPAGHLGRARCLINLAAHLGLQSNENVEQALSFAREGLQMIPAGHTHRLFYLTITGNLLGQRSRVVGEGSLAVVEEAISYTQEALTMIPEDSPDRHLFLFNLGVRYTDRYLCTRDQSDLEKAANYTRLGIKIMPENHPYGTQYEHSLAQLLRCRYNETGDIEALRDSIVNLQNLLEQNTNPVQRANFAYDLAVHLSDQYRQTGTIGTLEKAILYAQEALNVLRGHKMWSAQLCELCTLFRERFDRVGDTDDLFQGIHYGEEALRVSVAGDPRIPVALDCLSICFSATYTRTKNANDLDQAVGYSERARAEMASLGDQDRKAIMSNHANRLREKYFATRNINDLELAILNQQKILKVPPADDQNQGFYWHNLAQNTLTKYYLTQSLTDLQEAAESFKKSLECTPNDHPSRCEILQLAAVTLFKLSFRTDSVEEMEQSVSYLLDAYEITSAPPSERLEAVEKLCQYYLALIQLYAHVEGDMAHIDDISALTQTIFSFLDDAIPVLAQVAPRSLSRKDQQYQLSNRKIAENVASFALILGHLASDVVNLLELTRGIIIGLSIDCRSDISSIKDSNPSIYTRFSDLRRSIDSPLPSLLGAANLGTMAWAEIKRHRAENIKQMEETIADIRNIPGHERFLLTPAPQELMEIAKEGPIVYFITTPLQSTAIIIRSSTIKAIDLPELKFPLIPEWHDGTTHLPRKKMSLRNYSRANTEIQKRLLWLWNVAVKPVVQELQLTPRPTSDPNLPNIWWIGVGRMSWAPFHAAGDCSRDEECISNYASSSYTPTIKALSYARERGLTIGQRSRAGHETSRLLLVTMPTTPGSTALPAVVEEVSQISQIVGKYKDAVVKHIEHPSAEEVLRQLQCGGYHAIHLACHGVSNIKDPSQSNLILQRDGKADKLTVQDLSTKHIPDAQVAYLSACSTAESRTTGLADETIHIASGLQLAGFSHVLATMWPSDSNLCTQIAADFYSNLFDGTSGTGHGAVRIAFHRAVCAARQRSPMQPLKWAPFMHMGA